MNRIEFMNILEQLLAELPENERREAVQYYNDYLDDAGVENEQEVLKALGTPWQLAASIKEGLHEEKSNAGVFSERGFSRNEDVFTEEPPAARTADTKDAHYGHDRYRSGEKQKKSGSGTGMLILTILCAAFAAPILLPVALAVIVTVFALGVAAVAVAAALMIAGIICIVAGLAALVVAIAKFAVVPAGAMMAVGISLMTVGIGIILVVFMGWILGRFLPAAFRGSVNFCSRLFHRRRGGKA